MKDIKTKSSNIGNSKPEDISDSSMQNNTDVKDKDGKDANKHQDGERTSSKITKKAVASTQEKLDATNGDVLDQSADELASITAELNKSQDQNLRLQAEIQNMYKRFSQELARAKVSGLLDVSPVILETLDNLEKALRFYNPDEDNSQTSDGKESIQQGVELTYNTLLEGLSKFGIKEINPLDEKFDPEYHEALAKVKMKDKPKETVVAVIQKGYMADNRLLRAAKVQVAE